MKKTIALLLAVMMLVVCMTACTEQPTGPPETKTSDAEPAKTDGKKDSDEIVIGFVPYYRKDDFYKDLENAAIMKAEELGVKLIVQDPDTDTAKAIQIIEDFITQGVNAICTAPIGMEAMVPVLRKAQEAGIKTVTFDGLIEKDEGTVDCALRFDFAQCGIELGKLIEKYITEKGVYDGSTPLKTVIIDYPVSAQVGVPIIDNAKKYLADKGYIDVVAQQDGQADRNYSMGVMENIITAQAGDIELLIGFNYDACMGGVEAARARNVKLIAFSQLWGEEAFKQLEADDPEYKGGVAYSPTAFGAGAVEAATKLVRGEAVEKVTMLDPFMFTHDNIGDFDWQAIIDARK
jgi:ribose transport system substrate-binding protein